jgi:hypothetical protein
MEKLTCLRRRLAMGVESTMTRALTRLWENEGEKCLSAQKKIGKLRAAIRLSRDWFAPNGAASGTLDRNRLGLSQRQRQSDYVTSRRGGGSARHHRNGSGPGGLIGGVVGGMFR